MLSARTALQNLPGLLWLLVRHAMMGARTPHTIPGIATVQQLQLLGAQGEKPPGLGGRSCAWSIPRVAAPLGRILLKIGCPHGQGQRAAALGGFWLVRRQLYNHKTVCCCLSVSAG